MPCEHYKDALIEAAAGGTALSGELRVHLDECASCRDAFAEEQSLFAAIDSGLHAAANAEVPTSLLPRVRARLDEAGAHRNSWITNRFVLATAAVAVVAFFAVRSAWHANLGNEPVETAVTTSAPPRVTLPPQNQNTVVASTAEKNDVSPGQFTVAWTGTDASAAGEFFRKTEPEVLVPRDQEILLAEYASQWNLHKRAPLVTQDSDATILAQLQVAPIQITELDVKLLAEEK